MLFARKRPQQPRPGVDEDVLRVDDQILFTGVALMQSPSSCFFGTQFVLSLLAATTSPVLAGESLSHDLALIPANTWVKLSPLPNTPPSPRLGYEGACVWDSRHKHLIRYGGHNQGGGGEQNSEMWTFEPRSARWTLLEPNTSPPGICCRQQTVFNPIAVRYVQFLA